MSEAAGPVEARAKVNLYLHVTGRRADGYHTLDSLVLRLRLADRLTLARAAADRVTLSGPFAAALAAESAGRNLALAAVDALRRHAGLDAPVALALEKQIPVAAGLGGGSADAAAALLTGARLLGVELAQDELDRLAVGLGADVPACLRQAPVLVAGIGEMLRPASALPRFALVLVNPGVALSTAAVFAALEGACSAPMPLQAPAADLDELVAALVARRNDLEAPARRLVPAIGEALDMLAALPQARLARMSGSGATCFALVDDLDAAERAAAAVARARPDWWVRATPAVTGSGPR